MLKPDRLKACSDWIIRQPEMEHGWLSFDTRSLLVRMWEEKDAEADALRARIAELEASRMPPVVDMIKGDKLLLQSPRTLRHEERIKLTEDVTRALGEPSGRVLVLEGDWKYVVLRGASESEVVLESEDTII